MGLLFSFHVLPLPLGEGGGARVQVFLIQGSFATGRYGDPEDDVTGKARWVFFPQVSHPLPAGFGEKGR